MSRHFVSRLIRNSAIWSCLAPAAIGLSTPSISFAQSPAADDSAKPGSPDEKPADEKSPDEKPADEKPTDEKPTDEKRPDETPADETTTDKKPAARKPSETDLKLLQELVPDLPVEPLDGTGEKSDALPDELERAVRSMRDASGRLEKGDLSEETTALQKTVLDDLDALLKKLKNPPPSQPQDSNSSPQDQKQNQQEQKQQQDQQQQNEQQRQPKPSAQQQQQAGSRQGSQSGQQATQSSRSEESSEQNERKAKEREIELARRRALIDEVWGHLPPAVREKLLNVGSETLIPKYEFLIRRYYESLAETLEPGQPPRRAGGR